MDLTSSAAKRTGQTAPHRFEFAAGEIERFLRIVSRASAVRRHYELFQLLQDEVRYFIPHQILISAWGDFRGPGLHLDVISALPGVRTTCLQNCDIDNQVRELHARWVTCGRQVLLLENTGGRATGLSDCECPLHRSLKAMPAVLVHGVHDARDGTDSLYLAANDRPIGTTDSVEHFGLRINTIICQFDVAFRRVARFKPRVDGAPEKRASGREALSAREEEILAWVSAGRTNLEISKIVAISAFTVKNHVQRIIKKLGAANRTEAVAKYRQISIRGHERPAHSPGRAAQRHEATLGVE